MVRGGKEEEWQCSRPPTALLRDLKVQIWARLELARKPREPKLDYRGQEKDIIITVCSRSWDTAQE
jgi:hypothetical protein